jgi:hypothetical protein
MSEVCRRWRILYAVETRGWRRNRAAVEDYAG